MAILSIPCLRCRATAQADENAPGASCPSCGLVMPPPAAAAWMVSREGTQPFGPYTIAQVIAYLGQSQVLPTDNLWHQGAPDWVQAGQLPALAGAAAPAAQPTPQQPYAAPEQPYAPQPQAQPYGAVQPYGAPAQPYGAPAQPYGGQPYGAPVATGPGFGLHFKRAVNWNLSSIEILPEERAILLANGVDDDHAGRFLIWRRSVLGAVMPITLVSALLAVVSGITGDRGWAQLSAFGILVDLLRVLSLFALPAAAFMAQKIWYRQRRSRNTLITCFMVAFATPLVLGLIPFSWLMDLGSVNPMERAQAAAGAGFIGAILVYVTLMPAVLSLIPGVLRACLRIKALLPEATLPGWFLVAASPLYILLFLVIFSVVNQIAGHFLLILGVLALLISPVLYVVNSSTFTKPLRTPAEIAKVGTVQNLAMGIAIVGVVMLVLWTFVGGIGPQNIALIGGEGSSILRPWNPRVLQFPIDFVGRSLFTTVVVADLIMQMNVSMWRHDKQSEGVAEAAHYDRMMAEIEEAGAKTEVRMPPPAY